MLPDVNSQCKFEAVHPLCIHFRTVKGLFSTEKAPCTCSISVASFALHCCSALDVIVAFDVNAALDTLLSVERVTIDRSLSLLTSVLI